LSSNHEKLFSSKLGILKKLKLIDALEDVFTCFKALGVWIGDVII
jgi:hypothetical protein